MSDKYFLLAALLLFFSFGLGCFFTRWNCASKVWSFNGVLYYAKRVHGGMPVEIMIDSCERSLAYDDKEKVLSFYINNEKHTASDIESFLAGLKAAHSEGIYLNQFKIEQKGAE